LTYLPVLAGLITAFCWGTADFMSRGQSERVGNYATVVYSHLVTLLALLALLPAFSPALNPPLLPILALFVAGGLNFIAFLFLYRAFHKGVVSVVAPVAYTYPAVTTILSIVVLGTVLGPSKALAIGGIIVGVVLLSTRFSELRAYFGGRGAANLTKGIGPAIGSSIFFGAVYIGVGYAAPYVSLVFPALILRIVGTLAGFLLAPLFHQSLRPSRVFLSNTVIVMGLLEAAGFLVFTYGISTPGGSLPVVAAISGMGGAVAASYGLALLKERIEWNQMVGVILSILGVFTLLYLGS
jgi:drug/metabolite transporter (DMT)-like permease